MPLAVYASTTRTWTASLDEFALLSIGQGIAGDALLFISAAESKKVDVLDELEGWIGDGMEDGGWGHGWREGAVREEKWGRWRC